MSNAISLCLSSAMHSGDLSYTIQQPVCDVDNPNTLQTMNPPHMWKSLLLDTSNDPLINGTSVIERDTERTRTGLIKLVSYSNLHNTPLDWLTVTRVNNLMSWNEMVMARYLLEFPPGALVANMFFKDITQILTRHKLYEILFHIGNRVILQSYFGLQQCRDTDMWLHSLNNLSLYR